MRRLSAFLLLFLVLVSFVCIRARAADVPLWPQYTALRSKILSLTPETFYRYAPNRPSVWGVVVDVNLDVGIITVISLADVDGTTSIYVSDGGAFLGIGAADPIAETSKELRTHALAILHLLRPVHESPPPPSQAMRITALTESGLLSLELPVQEASTKSHALYPIWVDYNELLARNRVVSKAIFDRQKQGTARTQ